MNKFIKQVVNSVAVQAAAYAVTEGSKVIWPKAKKFFQQVVDKTDEQIKVTKTKMEFAEVIKNTKDELERQIDEKQRKKAQPPTTKASQPPPVDAKFKS